MRLATKSNLHSMGGVDPVCPRMYKKSYSIGNGDVLRSLSPPGHPCDDHDYSAKSVTTKKNHELGIIYFLTL